MGFYNGILEEEWFFFIQEHLLTFFYFFFVGFRLGKLERCFLEKIFCFFFIQERQLTFFTYFFFADFGLEDSFNQKCAFRREMVGGFFIFLYLRTRINVLYFSFCRFQPGDFWNWEKGVFFLRVWKVLIFFYFIYSRTRINVLLF